MKVTDDWRKVLAEEKARLFAKERPTSRDMILLFALDSALSHAAGQDGEQCRAASVASAEIESVIERLAAEAAACITVLGRAPEASDVRVMLDAAKLLRALSRGVPEGR